MSNIKTTLDERGARYGDYKEMAKCICGIQRVIHDHIRPDKLSASQMHALDMFACKIGRILTGDANYDDNWRDIAGYALKVLDELEK